MDPSHTETYDHIASRTIVNGKRVSEIPKDQEHPAIFGDNLEEIVSQTSEPPQGMREVVSSASLKAKAQGQPAATAPATTTPAEPAATAPTEAAK